MTWRLVIVGLALAVLVGGVATPKESKRTGVLAPLEAGQRVSLREKDYGYEIEAVPGEEGTHKVVEVGSDYVVLEDAAGASEVRIPLCAVKAVKVFRAAKDKKPPERKAGR